MYEIIYQELNQMRYFYIVKSHKATFVRLRWLAGLVPGNSLVFGEERVIFGRL